MSSHPDFNQVLHFWFEEIEPADWWKKAPSFDQLIRERFFSVHAKAIKGELFSWRATPHGRLAEIIVLDQFSRNLFRERPESFRYDPMALVLCQEAVAMGADASLSAAEKAFLYMPMMHSESLLIHEQAVKYFNQPGLEHNLKFEYKHRVIIERFGRYPHRNEILGRPSSEEELAFLQQPDSSF